MDSAEERVRRFLNALPEPSGGVLVACSGGADSVTLLHMLHSMRNFPVACAHYNHGLRGAESDRDENFVRDLCARLNIPCRVERGDVAVWAKTRKQGIEAAARELRYAFLNRAATELDCRYIATAHTADDNAETVILNLVRGSGARGLSGIPEIRGNLIRPLLTVTRAEVEDYLCANDLSHVEDSSNQSEAFRRNRIRKRIIPILQTLNPRAVETICATAALLREDETCLNDMAEDFLRKYPPTEGLPVDALLSLPKPIVMRVLRGNCPGAGRVHLETLYGLCMGNNTHASADIPGGRVTRRYDRLYFAPPSPIPPVDARALEITGVTAFPELGLALYSNIVKTPNEGIYKSFNTLFFKYDKICGKISAGTRNPGGKLHLPGRGCGKTLKQLFAETKTPQWQRSRTLVFTDDQGLLGVAGFGADCRCVPAAGDQSLRVEIRDIEC